MNDYIVKLQQYEWKDVELSLKKKIMVVNLSF